MSVALHAFAEDWAPAVRLAALLDVPLSPVHTHTFPDGECLPRVPKVAQTTLVYRSLDRPNAKLVELLLAADAWRRGGVRRLVLVAPYLPYMRQDKAFSEGEPVSQRVVADLLDSAFDRIVTVDPHLHRTASLASLFTSAEYTVVRGGDALVSLLRSSPYAKNLVVVGPDAESEQWARHIAEGLGLRYGVLSKERRGDRNVVLSVPDGLDVRGASVLLVDDICSSGATLVAAITTLKAAGARAVGVFVTHALWNEAAIANLRASGAEWIAASDSCNHPAEEVRLAKVLAAALKNEL
jgi:ribose-phosphate pyrophosphokinase